MRILILVASCRTPPYDALQRAQHATWDSRHVTSIETDYYWCTDLPSMVPCFIEALESALDHDALDNFEWDFIFRTNSSSYVDKARLLEYARASSPPLPTRLPLKRCYHGIDGDGFASGAGFFISRDVAEILQRDLGRVAAAHSDLIEDQAIGRCLAEHGIGVTPGARREDYWLLHFQSQFYGLPLDEKIREAYHIRCKADGIDREKDIEAMEHCHRIKTAR